MNLEYEDYKRINLYSQYCLKFIDFKKYKEINPEITQITPLDKFTNSVSGYFIEGFEPIMSPHFMNVFRKIKQNNNVIIIQTTGLALTKEIVWKIMKNSVIDFVILGYDEVSNDYISGIKNFEFLIRGMKRAKEEKIQAIATVYVFKSNIGILEKIVNLISNYGIEYIRFVFPRVYWIKKEYFDSEMPFASLFSKKIRRIAEMILKMGIDFHVENFAYCLLPFFERYVFAKEEGRKHLKVCERCGLKKICSGYFEDYLLKSNDDLEPLNMRIDSEYIVHKDSVLFPPNPFTIYDYETIVEKTRNDIKF